MDNAALQRRELEAEHRAHRIRSRLLSDTGGSHLGDAVLGAIDGGITSFAIVAGAVGAGFSGLVVVILGFASLLADGFSMAVSNFVSRRSDKEASDKAHHEERRHIELIPEGEREELRQIFLAKGFDGETLERIVDTISRDHALWADTIVREVFRLQADDARRPLRAGLTTFAAFVATGLIPLLPFLISAITLAQAFIASVVATSAAFLTVGFLKGRALRQPLLRASIETLLIGGGAALLAFGVGALLRMGLGQELAL